MGSCGAFWKAINDDENDVVPLAFQQALEEVHGDFLPLVLRDWQAAKDSMFPMCGWFGASTCEAVLNTLRYILPHLGQEVVARDKFDCIVSAGVSCGRGIMLSPDDQQLKGLILRDVYFSRISEKVVGVVAFSQGDLL